MVMMNIDGCSLSGHILTAMPGAGESVFDKTVVFVCRHDKNGAMGFVINQLLENLELCDILRQTENFAIDFPSEMKDNPPVHWGGPVEMNRGFVLHSLDYKNGKNTAIVNDDYGVTANVDVLDAIFTGNGPKDYILALGYVGWEEYQLEEELASHAWLVTPPDRNLIFYEQHKNRWKRAIEILGVRDDCLLLTQGNS
ncbi:YqgE/AlgH family protein [Candidatus Hydrogenosomobacter endosymbioticus]|uniref:UPF0301 protein HYD_2280 n=1 Tax=Candidatus Hydrogenosomobacter endosymbioticus TaxID=2558174 RepID=A0ABM7V8I3_9PROT|nr:YqgE/AlgH family protein [Candidatus Hydrogenosomobacter endosymbioticus]BDB96095.1 UPF0301 protein [Candidatus Hydrogenosomobacter endosymbioticus]